MSRGASQDHVVHGKQNTRSSVTIHNYSKLSTRGSNPNPRLILGLSTAFTQVIHSAFRCFYAENPQVFRRLFTRAFPQFLRRPFRRRSADSTGRKWAKDRRWMEVVEKWVTGHGVTGHRCVVVERTCVATVGICARGDRFRGLPAS